MEVKKRYFNRLKKAERSSNSLETAKVANVNDNAIFYWIPRILSLAFVMFLSVFSLDVFETYRGIHIVFPLIMHLLPVLVLLACILFEWHFDLYEAGIFLIFALIYVLLIGLRRDWTFYAAISGPALVISLLFLFDWYLRKKKEKNISP